MTFVFSINAFRNSHQRCSIKKLFLKISQYSQKNTCSGVSFEYCEIFKSAFFGEHLGTDAFLCFPISYRNFLCYFRKDFNFSMLKTPTMNLEKMLKIIYQKGSYFISFGSDFLTSFLLSEHLCLQAT